MPQQDIINAIHSLAKEGKKISTATVKARLNGSVELAALLPLISRYKQSPHSLPEAEPTPSNSTTHSPSKVEQALAERVAELEIKVARLEQRLTAQESRS
ncbi:MULTISPECIES: hypothetical protein [Oceanisphaera]|uniref:KfrA N-terminal DNA-binding domain-containing protein n=1 Tax=Oceanisphaera ostreae TaxID=914151 RepID=A0ABW3KIC3_9GAMM